MSKSGKSSRSNGKLKDDKQDDTATQAGSGVAITGTIDGKVRDVEVGLITGDVTQTNSSDQGASNVSIGSGGSQATGQGASQSNAVIAEGNAALDITVKGTFKGQIRDVEVGLITGDVTQTNVSKQAAGNLSVGSGGGSQTIGQDVLQENVVVAIGDVEVSMVFSGAFQGKVRDLEVGLITADVTQTNTSFQGAGNVSVGGGSGGSQTIGQAAGQGNYVVAVGDVDITLVFEGDFKGQVRDISIGVVTGDVSQTNTSVQVGMNISAGRHSGPQSIEQFITQTNVIDASGDVEVIIRFDPYYKGDYRDIELSLLIDNVLQSNTSAQFASNAAIDAVLA